MFSSITDLPRFHNFNEAVETYNNTKGIRGRENLKPLKYSRRNPDSYRIDAIKDGGGNIRAIQCWLYRTPVLTYTPDHLIVTAYNSQTTNNFIAQIAPNWLRAAQHNNCQVFFIRHEGEFLSSAEDKLVVPVNADYQPIKGEVKAAKLNRVVLNRTRAAQARKGCKDVVQLATLTSKIDGYWDALVHSDEETDDKAVVWLKGLLKNGGYITRERGNGEMLHYGFGTWGKHSAEELLPALKKRLYNAQYSEHTCYDKTPAEYGVIPKEWEML